MQPVLAIAANELRRSSKDRAVMGFTFGLPVLIMLLVGATFGSTGDVDLGVLDQDHTAESVDIVERLQSLDGVEVETYGTEQSLRRDVRTTARAAGIVLREGYGDDVLAGRARIELVIDPKSEEVAAALAVINGVVARAGVVAGAVALLATGLEPPAAADAEAEVVRQADELPPVLVEELGSGIERSVRLGTYSYPAPANLVLFVFTMTLAVSSLLANDRKAGVLHRMLASPVQPRAVLLGIGLSKVAFAGVQSVVLLAVGRLVFGVEWGDPVGVVLLVLLCCILAAAVGLIVGARVTDAEQAQAIGVPVAVAAGMLGGCMWPLEIVPDPMRMAGHVVPQAWVMDAWSQLIFDSAGVGDIATELAVLAGMALVAVAVAARGLRRALAG